MRGAAMLRHSTLSQLSQSSIARLEWQTVVLAIVIYGGFIGLTLF
jgi:fatty acid desaturase